MTMRLVLVLVGLLPLSAAFQRPLLLVHHHQKQPFTKLQASEFDDVLREGTTTTAINSRRSTSTTPSFKIAVGDDIILASATAVPQYTQQAAEAMEELTTSQEETGALGGDDEQDPYGLPQTMQKIQTFQEHQQATTMSQRLKKMDFQDLVLTLFIPSVLLFAGGRWTYNRVSAKVNDQTDSLLSSFASEMLYHDGDFDEMRLCVSDYKKRLIYLGPLAKDKMIKSYLEVFAKKKTVSPQSISSLSYVFTLFNLSEESAAKTLVSLCKEMGPEKVSSAGKLLFFGSRILKSPQGQEALQPIKDLIKSTYREASVAETMIETSQQAIAEAAYRSTVQAGGKRQKSLTVGWEVLGLDRATAERIWNEEAKEGFVTDRETMYGGQTTKYDKKGRRLDKDGKLENPEEADDDDEVEESASNVYECGECGYTLFVAQGREGKFFGNDFKCPECGAAKSKFKGRDDFGEDD